MRITDVLYRIGIEAVANAVRHAHATHIGLTAEYRSHALILTIEDDGEGFVPEEARESFGLRGMKKRVEQIGGSDSDEQHAQSGISHRGVRSNTRVVPVPILFISQETE